MRTPEQAQRGRRAANRDWARDLVLQRIRSLAARPAGLYRVHIDRPALYAQARRRRTTRVERLARLDTPPPA